MFKNRVNVIENKSICVNECVDNQPDALLDLHIARPGLEVVNKKQSLVISKVKCQKIAPAGGNNMLHNRAKPGKQFFITITFDYKVGVTDKFCIVNTVNVYQLRSYCLASEICEKSETGVSHLHCFFEYLEPVYILELCEYLRNIYNCCPIHVQPCRSKKSVLKYLSKSDTDLITNIRISTLHFNYQCFMWACGCIV